MPNGRKEGKNMKNTVKELKPREKAAIMDTAKKAVESGLNKVEAVKSIEKKMLAMNIVEKSGAFNEMLAVALAVYSMEKAKAEGKRPIECLKEYAHFKRLCGERLDDFGAFGDTLETCLRIACKPENLVSWNDLHVKRQSAVDITIKGVKFEIGNNGKTFLESEEEDPMAGKYEKIGYGVFSKEEQKALYILLENGEYKKAFSSFLSMVYVFDKETFFHSMTGKTGRGAMYTYKQTMGKWQVVYNPSKHGLFLKMVEQENIKTLAEWLEG